MCIRDSLGIVSDWHNIRFAESEAADVFVKINKFLKRHASGPGAVVGSEQLFAIIHLVNVLPSPAGKRLQNGRPADGVEQSVPINRVL